MSKDKYPSIILPQMEAIVFIIQIVFATRAVLKIGEQFSESIVRGKLDSFLESVSRGKLSFEEQIMSKDEYPSIFSSLMDGYCV